MKINIKPSFERIYKKLPNAEKSQIDEKIMHKEKRGGVVRKIKLTKEERAIEKGYSFIFC